MGDGGMWEGGWEGGKEEGNKGGRRDGGMEGWRRFRSGDAQQFPSAGGRRGRERGKIELKPRGH